MIQKRAQAEVSLRELGKAVNLSAIYLSDIERGSRRPPSPSVITKIATFIGADPALLLEAALRERTGFEFNIEGNEADKPRGRFVVQLARVWDEIGDEAFEELMKHLNAISKPSEANE